MIGCIFKAAAILKSCSKYTVLLSVFPFFQNLEYSSSLKWIVFNCCQNLIQKPAFWMTWIIMMVRRIFNHWLPPTYLHAIRRLLKDITKTEEAIFYLPLVKKSIVRRIAVAFWRTCRNFYRHAIWRAVQWVGREIKFSRKLFLLFWEWWHFFQPHRYPLAPTSKKQKLLKALICGYVWTINTLLNCLHKAMLTLCTPQVNKVHVFSALKM